MNLYDPYYREHLYPLQDGVMSIIKGLNTPFFLTGGTALNRHYNNYRYSDDLDLFVHSDSEYSLWVERILSEIINRESETNIIVDRSSIRRFSDFAQVFVSRNETREILLKIDFVNDVAAHFGQKEHHEILGPIDSWRNILSNKLSALFRFEPKDIVDLWAVSRMRPFNWKEIVQEAKQKEAGVEPEIVYNIIRSFPVEKLGLIKWIQNPDYSQIKIDLDLIAGDIFYGKDNSLFLQ